MQQLQDVVRQFEEIVGAQEEHVKQLLEQNQTLTEQVRIQNCELEQLENLDEKIEFILFENDQLKALNDRMQEQLAKSED